MKYIYGMLGSQLMFLGMGPDRMVNEMESMGYTHCFISSVWHPYAAMRPARK